MATSRPPGWQKEHMRRYLETGGRDGHAWEGVTTLLLTTKGRRSGEWRTTPLIYGRDGENYVVVASKGGAPQHPQWFRNLRANPVAEVEVANASGTEHVKVRARPVTGGSEHDELYAFMTEVWPGFADYQKKTDRKIPVVVLEPTG